MRKSDVLKFIVLPLLLLLFYSIIWMSIQCDENSAMPIPKDNFAGKANLPKLKVNLSPDKGFTTQSPHEMNYPNGNPMFKEGSFKLKVNLPLNEETTVYYIIPLDAKGRPLPSASNIVFYAPYTGDAKTFFSRPWHRYFPEVLGFTIFTMTIEANTEIANDRKQYYIYKESGWYDIVFKVQKHLTETFGLSARPLFVVGESSGGSMAQQLAELYPNKIDAAAWNGGAQYEPFKSHSNVALLALNTWGCSGIPATTSLKKQAEQYGIKVLCGEAPPVKIGHFGHHAASDMTYKLIHTFIRDIARLREQNNGKIPPIEKWPVTEIITGEKQYLPSLDFVALWKQLPHDATNKISNGNNDELIIFPQSGKANCIVFFAQDFESSNLPMLQDNLYFLAQAGSIPITIKLSNDYIKDVDRLKKALDTILLKNEWKTLPIHIIGNGIGGQLAAVAALSNGSKRIMRITTLNTSYEHPFDSLSIAMHRSVSSIPLKMIYGKADFLSPKNVPNTEATFIDGAEQDNKWFSILSEAVR